MLHYRRFGRGPAVVLVHGWLGGSVVWTPLITALAPFFEVIAPDLPGFADSRDQPVPDTVEGFSAAIMALIDSLGVERFRLLGHSAGGMTVQQMVLDHPDRVERLVLHGTSCRGDLPGRFETIEDSIARLRGEGVEAVAARVAPVWFAAGHDHPYHDLCLETARRTTLDGAVNCLEALRKWRVCERLGEIATPTLVICGEQDRGTVVEESFILWRGIADAQLSVIPGCAHNVHLEAPHLFNRIVVDFLRG